MSDNVRLTDIDILTNIIEDTDWYHINKNGELVLGANSVDDVPLYKAEDIYRVLENAPIADSVRHGYWEDFADKHDKRAKRHDFRCSICHNRASSFVCGRDDWWDIGKPNYCPNCGAKMDGGIEDATD